MIYQPERILLEQQIRVLVPKQPGKVLDSGGGDGKRYRHLFETKEYISVDIDAQTSPDIVASCESLPFSNDTFDTILSSQMLEHVTDVDKCLSEIYRVLKPEGKFILTVPMTNELHAEPSDYWRFTSYGIELLCTSSGFKIEELKQRGGYNSTIAQMRIRKQIDTHLPYTNPWAMKILGPITLVYSRIAIFRDSKSTRAINKKLALGWALLLSK